MRVAIVWEIWKQGNKVVFNHGVVDANEILIMAQLKAWSWLSLEVRRLIAHSRIGAYALCNAEQIFR